MTTFDEKLRLPMIFFAIFLFLVHGFFLLPNTAPASLFFRFAF